MAYDGHTVLAVVPARGGSKSIPRKNLAQIGGVSLVGRAAQIAGSLPFVDHAIVSTDDEEIAAEAQRHGVDAPFLRPAELAGDRSTSIDMWRHAWLAAEAHYGMTFALSVLLEPTSPLRTAADVAATVDMLIKSGRAAAATVSPTPAHFTPHKTLTLDADGVIGFFLDSGARHSIRQTIPTYYHRNGLAYAVRRETLVDDGRIIEQDCAAVIVDRPVVNIDEPFELEFAEWLLSRSDRTPCA